MAVIAIYNSKGGVGKTTLAVNLAWEAVRAGRRTLLWEIDSQGDIGWMLGKDRKPKKVNNASFMHGISDPLKHISPSKIPELCILSGDVDMRRTDNFFSAFARKQQLSHLFADLESQYDVVILDCPPGFSEAIRKILLFVHLVVVPIVPSPLAIRGMNRVRNYMVRFRGYHPPMLPVYSMVDYRRKLHKQALAEHPDWPTIGMSSRIENMSVRKMPVGAFAPESQLAQTFMALWSGIARKLEATIVLRERALR